MSNILNNKDTETKSYKDSLYTIDEKGRRKWVYPEVISGRFFKIRSIVAYLLMAFYLIVPWIRIEGKPFLLLNFPERVFIILGKTFWATDTIFLMLLLASLGLTLFFVTSLFGRIWCGWACPQTVFLEFLFRPIERLIEGDSVKRKRLDSSPWNVEKIFKKGLKHLLSAIFASLIANTALAYFIGTDKLIEIISSSPFNNPTLFAVMIFLMFLMAFEFGWFREQFCTVLCPYARFQSVMLDPDSLVIGYDYNRGEPRGKKSESNSGDCIDCKLCVRVCPTGIDIRNGLQLECVNCAQCIDACDSIMTKIGKSTGLIRYDTERKLLGGERKFLRPRLFVYLTILILYSCLFVYLLNNRTEFDFDVIKESQITVYQESPDGRIINQFRGKISNKSSDEQVYKLSASVINAPEGSYSVTFAINNIKVSPGQMIDNIPIFVSLDKDKLEKGLKEIKFESEDQNGIKIIKMSKFLGPTN